MMTIRPPEFEFLLDDKVQQEILLPLVTEGSDDMYRWRAIWRRLFPTEVPPWLDQGLGGNAGPYAVKGLLTGECCTVCQRPLYLTSNQKGITCAGGHGEKQRKKAAKKLLDGDGEYAQTGDPEDWEIPEGEAVGPGFEDDDDDFFE